MAKVLLNEEEFSRVVVTRARRERPDIRVTVVGRFLLLVEPEPGRRRVVSLSEWYEIYRETPRGREAVIGRVLANLIYEEPGQIPGGFQDHSSKILPQVVPPTLLDYCREENRELASVDFVGGLSVAFVLDEAERYSYIHDKVVEHWGVSQPTVVKAALENLQALNASGPAFHRIGRGETLTLVWETFDGYDASRILLTRELNEAAVLLPGNPVIGIPHRDYMVMFSDMNEEFAATMTDRIREAFEAHNYPITPRLFALVEGSIANYEGSNRRRRIVN